MTLSRLISTYGLTLVPARAASWRTLPEEEQRLATLRGSAFQGEVLPVATDGIHSLVIRRKDDTVLEVIALNILYPPKPKDGPDTARMPQRGRPSASRGRPTPKTRKASHTTRKASLSIESLLAEFLILE